MLERRTGDDWVGVGLEALPVAEALAFAVLPNCGGVVTFCGTVRDFSEGRDGVSALEYEAFEEQVIERLEELARSARRAWPEIGRIVMLHRTGRLEVGDIAVVVCASTPHRGEAFEVARYLIDTLKATIPIWKLETWEGGSQWSEGCTELAEIPELPTRELGGVRPSAHGHRHGDEAHRNDAGQGAGRPS